MPDRGDHPCESRTVDSSRFFFQAEDGIRDHCVTGVQTCALPISRSASPENGLSNLTARIPRAAVERAQLDLDPCRLEYDPSVEVRTRSNFTSRLEPCEQVRVIHLGKTDRKSVV